MCGRTAQTRRPQTLMIQFNADKTLGAPKIIAPNLNQGPLAWGSVLFHTGMSENSEPRYTNGAQSFSLDLPTVDENGKKYKYDDEKNSKGENVVSLQDFNLEANGDLVLVNKAKISPSPYRLAACQWGIIPSFAKNMPKIRPFNARIETALELPTFSLAFSKHRCVVIIDGFYEWHRENKQSIPYFISTPKKPMYLAGFYSVWKPVNANSIPPKLRKYYLKSESLLPWEKVYNTIQLPSYCLLTTEMAKPMRWLHDRMPVILPNLKAVYNYLDPQTNPQSIVDTYRKPFGGNLVYFPVGKTVNRMGRNSSFICRKPQGPIHTIDLTSGKKTIKGGISGFFIKSKSARVKREPLVGMDSPPPQKLHPLTTCSRSPKIKEETHENDSKT